MKLVIVSGLSGSGKSIALGTLEDCGYYCIDNLPVALLKDFITHVMLRYRDSYHKTAIGIDARNRSEKLQDVPACLDFVRDKGIECKIVYMEAEESALLKRYSETRRRHPLTNESRSLREALQMEREMLLPLAQHADITLDTSYTQYHQLREMVKKQLGEHDDQNMCIQFLSFGYKYGIPLDADFVFDARCLPNPHWLPDLRDLTGKDEPVADYLRGQPAVMDFLQDISVFLLNWSEHFAADNRSYLTIAIGCTGGRHRSVFLAESLGQRFLSASANIIVRHRELHA